MNHASSGSGSGSGRRSGGRVGPYSLIRELGRGAMGVVYEARHDDGRRVALKVMLERGSAQRFAREIEAVAGLNHPHVVAFVDASREPPLYLAMEFVDGEDLGRRLAGEPLPPTQVARWLAQVADAVAHAHAHGVIHRDLKPGNVLIRADGVAVVTDFGLARATDADRLTRTGAAVGSVLHMAPEQLRGEREVGPPADVWALGTILYRCLAGQDAFEADELVTLLRRIQAAEVTPLARVVPGVPADLAATTAACFRVDPAQRPSAAELRDALRARRPLGAPALRGRAPVVAGLLLALGVAGAAAVLATAQRAATPVLPRTAAVSPDGLDAASGAVPVPWPAQPGWERVWSLGVDAAPALWPERAWAGAGREVDAARAWDALLLGDVRELGDGAVELDVDLDRALWEEVGTPHAILARGQPGDVVLQRRDDGSVSWRVPNDCGAVSLFAGNAWWEGIGLRLRLRRVESIDTDALQLSLGDRSRSGPYAQVAGRRQRFEWVCAERGSAPYLPGVEWDEVAFWPEGPAGERVVINGARAEAGLRTANPGPLQLVGLEAHYALARLQVWGRPLRTDRFARARPPATGGEGPASIAALIEAPAGRPFVGLGPADGEEGVRLVWAPRQLELWRGPRRLVTWACPEASSGWLRLAAEGDLLRVEAEVGDLRLDEPLGEPLPCPRAAASYGVEGGAARFAAVEVAGGPVDVERRAYDQASPGDLPAKLAAARAASSPVRAAWWEGALLLDGLIHPTRLDLELLGRADAIRARAQSAAALLEQAMTGLEGAARVDALARAAVARVLSGEVEAAEVRAVELVAEAGLAGGREAVDRLVRRQNCADGLVQILLECQASLVDHDTSEAGFRVVAVVAPELQPQVAFMQAGNLEMRARERPEERERLLGRANALLERARAGGVTGYSIDCRQGDVLILLERYAEARACWWRATRDEQATWWAFARRSECERELGEGADALESAVGALALAPTREALAASLIELVQQEASRHPGRCAAAMVALADSAAGARSRAELLAQAAGLARRADPQDPRELGLATYARVRQGEPLPAWAAGDEPLAVLARATAGDPAALEALTAAGEADPLVGQLARLHAPLRQVR